MPSLSVHSTNYFIDSTAQFMQILIFKYIVSIGYVLWSKADPVD